MTYGVQNQDQQKEYEQKHDDDVVVNNHTGPGVLPGPHDLERLRQAYEEVIGRLNSIVAGEIERYLKRGMEVDLIIEAIECTAWAPNPTPYYLRAVLRRWAGQGVWTVGQHALHEADHRRLRANLMSDKEEKWYE